MSSGGWIVRRMDGWMEVSRWMELMEKNFLGKSLKENRIYEKYINY